MQALGLVIALIVFGGVVGGIILILTMFGWIITVAVVIVFIVVSLLSLLKNTLTSLCDNPDEKKEP